MKHIALADGLGLTTVAEGIETANQHHLLRDLTCTFGQGYLFSKPLLADQIHRCSPRRCACSIPVRFRRPRSGHTPDPTRGAPSRRGVTAPHATALAAPPRQVGASSSPACQGPSGLCAPHARAFRVETACQMTNEPHARNHTQSFGASCPCGGSIARPPGPQVLPRSVSGPVPPQHPQELRRLLLRGSSAGHRAARP